MIDWNQSWEIALLALTPQSERQCGLAEICRADYFSPSWTAFQAERGRDFSVIVDGVSV